MAETLTITCDVCGERVAKAYRSRLKWAAQGACPRGYVDLCEVCGEELAVRWGRRPKSLFLAAGADGRPAAAAPQDDPR
jgi:hypothetical protein